MDEALIITRKGDSPIRTITEPRYSESNEDEGTEEWTVCWMIQVNAVSPEDAACIALAIQQDPHSTATVFECTSATIGPITVDIERAEEPLVLDELRASYVPYIPPERPEGWDSSNPLG